MQEIIELFKTDLARETIVSLWVHIVLLAVSLFVGAKALRPIKAILGFPFKATKGAMTRDLEERFGHLMERYKNVLRNSKSLQERQDRQQMEIAHLRDMIAVLKNQQNQQQPINIDHSWTAAGDGTFKVENSKAM